MKKKTRNIVLGIAVVIVLVLLASPKIRLFPGDGKAAPTEQDSDPRLPVEVYVTGTDTVRRVIKITGTVLANEGVELRSEIAGKVQEIHFDEGRRVRGGELLLKINDAELQAQRDKLVSQRKLAEDKERRRKILFDRQNISPEDYEIALNELNMIVAELSLVEAKIDKTEIRAPFDGNVGLRYVSLGSYISTDTRIATLQNTDAVKIDFSIPEKYVNTIRVGQPISFTVAGSEKNYVGTVYAIEPKIDPVTRTVLLRARASNKGRNITPGAFAEVTLVLETINDALMIPTIAVIPELQGQKLYLFHGGEVASRSVNTGLRTDTTIQITGGLDVNDTVITSGLLQVRPGMPVRIATPN
jgi:membrane fusion protein, multidrug efflux system